MGELKPDKQGEVGTIKESEDFADEEAEFFSECFRISVAEEQQEKQDISHPGWCSPMPKGLSPPADRQQGQVAGAQQQGV